MLTRCCTPLLLTVLASPACASGLARITAALPDVEPPPQGEVQWVARSMRLNGLPMTLKVFNSGLDPQSLLQHYEMRLKTGGDHEIVRWMNAPWHVLASVSRRYVTTVQARATPGGSEGTIVVSSALANADLQLRTSFPLPASAHMVSLQQYDDAGVQSEHISLASSRSPAAEWQAFSQLLSREGWTLTSERRRHGNSRGYVLEAQKDSQHALLTILPDAVQPVTTAIVIIWRK